MDDTPGLRRLIFAVFTISGFSGLIYESVWAHYLKLFLGHAAYAQTLVLAIFMGGMALGSWLMARHSHRVANLLLGYAIVEGIIGLCGLLFHGVATGSMAWAFDSLLPNVGSVAAAQLAKWTLGAALILPQSILLGMTFPLMSGAIVRRFPERSGETLAMLYFTNSLGAAIGVLVSGFVLIGAVGLPGTILTAGIMNIGLAVFVWGFAKFRPEMVQAAAPTPPPQSAAGSLPASISRWMLIGAAVTGIASFLYEIAWIRMLALVLGGSTHAFEMMLSAFILGIALGGFWVHRRIDSMRDPVRFLSNILMIMAGVAVLSLPVYNHTFDLMGQIVRAFSATDPGYIGISVASNVIAILVMVPTTFFCGMTLPVITHVLLRNGAGERAIGAVYAWNTAGAIVGVTIAVHVLMPLVGVKGIVIAGATLQVLLAAIYRSKTQYSGSMLQRVGTPALAGLGTIGVMALLFSLDPAKLASGVYRHGTAASPAQVRLLEHGRTATISLLEANGTISISTNGKPDAALEMSGGTAGPDEITMVLAGAMPIGLHTHPRLVANIGLGSGLTTHVALASPAVQLIDTVEIEPVMAKAARIGFMPRVARAFEDPRSRIHFEDAKTFFAMHRKQYDVIVSEPSNPWVSGVSTLFSTEFYEQMTRYLAADGMLVQWIQIYETDMDIVLSIVKAMAPQFSDFALYDTDGANVLIVAVRSGTLPEPGMRMFESAAMAKELSRVGLQTPHDIRKRYLGNKALFVPLLRQSGVPANSDYFPFVDQNAARARILKRSAIELNQLHSLPVPLFELLEGKGDVRAETLLPSGPVTWREQSLRTALILKSAVLASSYESLSASQTRLLLSLESPANECAKPSVRRTWLSSATVIASETTPQLSASELAPMWDNIEATPCAAALQPHDRQFVQLLRAIATRDVARVAALGSGLLENGYSFAEPSQFQLALLATAASEISTGRPERALQLLQRNAGKTSSTPAVALAMRWMGAIGAARSQETLAGNSRL